MQAFTELFQFWLDSFGRGLKTVLWGDLVATPRGFAYLALAMGAGYLVATWRVLRMHTRAGYEALRVQSDGNAASQKAAREYQQGLWVQVTAKLRATAPWFAMTCGMLAAQAEVLMHEAWVNDDWRFTDSTDIVAGLNDARMVFGSLAVAIVSVWMTSHWIGNRKSPLRVRLLTWFDDLVAQTEPCRHRARPGARYSDQGLNLPDAKSPALETTTHS